MRLCNLRENCSIWMILIFLGERKHGYNVTRDGGCGRIRLMIKITNISQENLESMSRNELIRLCEIMGIEVLPRVNKEMLVDDILDQLEQKGAFPLSNFGTE